MDAQQEYSKQFKSVKGDKISFKDFVLIDQGITPPTDSQLRTQQEAFKQGIDGGAAIISDTWHLNVVSGASEETESIKLSMLPYGWTSFVANGKMFTIVSQSIIYEGDIDSARKQESEANLGM